MVLNEFTNAGPRDPASQGEAIGLGHISRASPPRDARRMPACSSAAARLHSLVTFGSRGILDRLYAAAQRQGRRLRVLQGLPPRRGPTALDPRAGASPRTAGHPKRQIAGTSPPIIRLPKPKVAGSRPVVRFASPSSRGAPVERRDPGDSAGASPPDRGACTRMKVVCAPHLERAKEAFVRNRYLLESASRRGDWGGPADSRKSTREEQTLETRPDRPCRGRVSGAYCARADSWQRRGD